MNIVVLNAPGEKWENTLALPPGQRRVDVWWQDDATGRLMLLFAYLMTRTPDWECASIRLLAPVDPESGEEKTREHLETLLAEARISARTEVLTEPNMVSVAAWSASASLVFLPFRIRQGRMLTLFDELVEESLEAMPLTALVLAATDVELDAEPEDGKAAEAAAAMDALEQAEKNAREMEKNAKAAQKDLEEKTRVLKEAALGEGDANTRETLEAEASRARETADDAGRRLAKARAKLEHAQAEEKKEKGRP
ncbi:MAG: hypothetical protein ABIM40_14495 [Pseudomonadota bacterium]